jgi:hypothetical protein
MGATLYLNSNRAIAQTQQASVSIGSKIEPLSSPRSAVEYHECLSSQDRACVRANHLQLVAVANRS